MSGFPDPPPFPDPYFQELEKYFPFVIIYGLILGVFYILWQSLEWLMKRRKEK